MLKELSLLKIDLVKLRRISPMKQKKRKKINLDAYLSLKI